MRLVVVSLSVFFSPSFISSYNFTYSSSTISSIKTFSVYNILCFLCLIWVRGHIRGVGMNRTLLFHLDSHLCERATWEVVCGDLCLCRGVNMKGGNIKTIS